MRYVTPFTTGRVMLPEDILELPSRSLSSFFDDHVVLVFWIAFFGDGLSWERADHLTHHLQAMSPYFN